jgi:UDP-N-acetylmuramate: L-alanyl-gamma-D-glutamyl-meso-diaminopimelate ligase
MKLHILGIAGTFMGGVAALARELGHAVEGSDQNIYPPMSTQLEQLGIALKQGYSPFVVEADEYDTAFFDKRSKFVHYRPRTAILNNLEFDHADIFDDLAAIERQFHHLVRTVPLNGPRGRQRPGRTPARSAGDGLLDAGGALWSGCVVRVERTQVAR